MRQRAKQTAEMSHRPASSEAQARHQRDQVFSILVADGGEFQAQALSLFGVLDGRFGADCAFLDQKVEVGRGADAPGLRRLQKDAADAQIANARHVIAAVATPVDPDMLG